MNVLKGSVDVTTYFHLRLAASGLDATGLTISDVDMQYVRNRTAPTAKVDAVALAATDTAHTDNRGIEIDATDQPGLYRFDWPDAAFATGVDKVLLTIKVATAFTETLQVDLVNYNPEDGVRLGLTALPNAAADAAGGLPISDAGGLDLDAKLANTNEVTAARMGALTDWINGGRLDLILDIIAADTTTDIPALIADLPTNAELATALGTADDAVLAQVALVKVQTDLIPAAPASTTNITAGVITTVTNLTNAPTNGDLTATMKTSVTAAVPTAAAIADQVWDEAIAGHLGAGSTGLALNSAGSAGDPWNTALPGAYGAGTAGKIVGDNINATVGSRSSQTSVDDLPTNAELTTALGTADDAALAQIALVKAKTDLIPASPAAVGSAMTLTSGERDSIAAALLDLASAIETGLTVRQALRLALAALAGEVSGAETTTVLIRNAVADSKVRLTATVTAGGDRTGIVTDVT